MADVVAGITAKVLSVCFRSERCLKMFRMGRLRSSEVEVGNTFSAPVLTQYTMPMMDGIDFSSATRSLADKGWR